MVSRAMVRSTRQAFAGERQLLFVNAWNEWAEGNYLEPDQRFGHGYLRAVRLEAEKSVAEIKLSYSHFCAGIKRGSGTGW